MKNIRNYSVATGSNNGIAHIVGDTLATTSGITTTDTGTHTTICDVTDTSHTDA